MPGIGRTDPSSDRHARWHVFQWRVRNLAPLLREIAKSPLGQRRDVGVEWIAHRLFERNELNARCKHSLANAVHCRTAGLLLNCHKSRPRFWKRLKEFGNVLSK
jgi:hypothetical protein